MAAAAAAADAKQAKAKPTQPLAVPAVNRDTHPAAPTHLMEWIAANAHAFQPPVGNKLLHGAGCQFKVMVVGGPNTRTDYHINTGEEWFVQLRGTAVLKVMDGGRPRDVVIPEGHAFCLPACVPHSPQRYADTYGLVLEHDRYDGLDDGLRWYCQHPGCGRVVFETFFKCQDLGSQLKVLINAYYADENMRTCKHCGTVDQRATLLTVDQAVAKAEVNNKHFATLKRVEGMPWIDPATHPDPYDLRAKLDALAAAASHAGTSTALHSGEWQVSATVTPKAAPKSPALEPTTVWHTSPASEEWVWQWHGTSRVLLLEPATAADDTAKAAGAAAAGTGAGAKAAAAADGAVMRAVELKAGNGYLIPRGVPHAYAAPDPASARVVVSLQRSALPAAVTAAAAAGKGVAYSAIAKAGAADPQHPLDRVSVLPSALPLSLLPTADHEFVLNDFVADLAKARAALH